MVWLLMCISGYKHVFLTFLLSGVGNSLSVFSLWKCLCLSFCLIAVLFFTMLFLVNDACFLSALLSSVSLAIWLFHGAVDALNLCVYVLLTFGRRKSVTLARAMLRQSDYSCREFSVTTCCQVAIKIFPHIATQNAVVTFSKMLGAAAVPKLSTKWHGFSTREWAFPIHLYAMQCCQKR